MNDEPVFLQEIKEPKPVKQDHKEQPDDGLKRYLKAEDEKLSRKK